MRRRKWCHKCKQFKKFHKGQSRCISCLQATHRRFRKKFPLRRTLVSARYRAKNSGTAFTLTYENLPRPFPKLCPVLGCRLLYNGPIRHPRAASIDRICPNKGYRPGNVAIISRRANLLKNNATISEVASILDYMLEHAR